MAEELDVLRFEQLIYVWLAIPDNTTTGTLPIVRSPLGAGISRWSDFILLLKDQVNNLTYRTQASTDNISLPVPQKNLVMVALTLLLQSLFS
jgi:hypothetical protein